MATLRPWIDGRIPADQRPTRLLASARADAEVAFLEREGDRAARVEYPIASGNEIVAPIAEGVYQTGAVCPAVLGADGRIAIVYPPLHLDFEADTTPVGDQVELQEERAQRIDTHEQILSESQDEIAATKDRLDATDWVVDGLAVDVSRHGVDIQGAVRAAQSAGSRAADAQSKADKAESDAADAQSKADAAASDLLVLAGRSGRVIRSGSAPTAAADKSSNNLWLNTSTGQLSEWTGSKWQVVTDSRLTAAADSADQAANLAGNAQSQADLAKTLAEAAQASASTADGKASAAQTAAAAADSAAQDAGSRAADAQSKADKAELDAADAAADAVSKAAAAESAAKAYAAAQASAAEAAAKAAAALDAKSKADAAEAAAKAAAALDAKSKADAARAAAEGKAAAAQARADKAVSDAAAAQSQSDLAYWKARADAGRVLYEDPTFAKGTNSMHVYGWGTGTLTRVVAPDGTPTTSGHILRATTTESSGTFGKLLYPISLRSRSGAIFVQTIVAKAPEGTQFLVVSNSVGTGTYGAEGLLRTPGLWLTPNVATGHWQEYVRLIVCGVEGPFSTTGHVRVRLPQGHADPTEADPFVVDVAYSTVVDVTDSPEAFPGQLLSGIDAAETLALSARSEAAAAQLAANSAAQDAVDKASAAQAAAEAYALAQAAAAQAAAVADASQDATAKAAAAQAAAEVNAAADALSKANAAQAAAEAKAATAQARADKAASDAAAAQARADKAVSDAADAQSAADGAQQTAGEALSIANMSAEQLASAFDDEPPEDPVADAIWFPRNDEGQVTGLWQWNEHTNTWGTHTTLTGLLVVPSEDGGETIIGPDGLDATKVVADLIRAPLLYADVAGVKTLVVTDIPRENLDEGSQEALDTADILGSRILIDGADGSITIALETRGEEAAVTYTKLTATRMNFVVKDELAAYIDGPRSQLYADNAYIGDTLIVGAHQINTIPGSNITTWQAVN